MPPPDRLPPLPEGFTLDAQTDLPPLPQGFTLDQPGQAAAEPPQSLASRLLRNYAPLGAAELGLHIGTGMVSTPVNEAIATGAALLPGGRTAEDVMANPPVGTYQPRSEVGQRMAGELGNVMAPVGQFINYATRGFAGEGQPQRTPEAVEHGLKTAISAVPFLGPISRAVRGARAPVAATAAAPEALARQFAERRMEVSFDALPAQFKAQLTEIAKDAKTLNALDPAALKRQALTESLGMQATAGQLSRDPVQLRLEGNISATQAGRPIRDIYQQQNRAIIEQLENVRAKTGGTATTPEQVGRSVQEAARAKLALRKQEVTQLYNAAEQAGELQGRVSTIPLWRMVQELANPKELGFAKDWLRSARTRLESRAPGQEAQRIPDRNSATLKELETLRQAAVVQRMNGGSEGHYAGKLIGEIDRITEGAGGEMYKQARAARRAQALEFEEQAGVSNLVRQESRTDRALALEDTWRKSVIGGSIEDLQNIKQSLLTGGNEATRTAGQRAWKDLQAQTIQEITDQASRGVARFEDGTPNVTPAALQRAIKQIDPEKLEMLFGRGTVKRLNDIMEGARIAKTEPPAGFKGSPTFANTITFLESMMRKVPFLGDVGTGTIKAAAAVRELGQAGRQVSAAQQTPIGTALRQSLTAQKRAQRGPALPQLGTLPNVALTEAEQRRLRELITE